MEPKVTILRRCLEHLCAALVFAMPVNAMITYGTATALNSPLAITLTTSLLATLVSFVRTYVVLYKQDARELKLQQSQ